MERFILVERANPKNLLGDTLQVANPSLDLDALTRAKEKLGDMAKPLGVSGFKSTFKPYLAALPKGGVEAGLAQYVDVMANAFQFRSLATVVAGIESYIKNGGRFWPSIGDLMQAFDEQDARLNAMVNAVDRAIEKGPEKRLAPAKADKLIADTSGLGPEFDANGKPNWFVGGSGKVFAISQEAKAALAKKTKGTIGCEPVMKLKIWQRH